MLNNFCLSATTLWHSKTYLEQERHTLGAAAHGPGKAFFSLLRLDWDYVVCVRLPDGTGISVI